MRKPQATAGLSVRPCSTSHSRRKGSRCACSTRARCATAAGGMPDVAITQAAEDFRSAVRYLEDGASAWVRGKSCISHFSTYIATAHALQALALCGEISVSK